MKKIIPTTVLFSMLMFLPGQSLAHDAEVVIDTIGTFAVIPDVDTAITVPGFPFGLNFEGTVTHQGQGNLNGIHLQATVNGELVYGPESLRGSKKATTTGYLIPWVVYEPGQYVVEITGFHKGAAQNERCTAAPALANTYLRQNVADLNREVISEVAKETGKKGSLWAKEKCEDAYFSKTITFILETAT